MRKVLVILVLLLSLCSCTKEKDNTFIMPVNEYNLFERLNTDTRINLYRANNSQDLENIQLINLFKEFKTTRLIDIDGNEVDLNDYKDKQVIIEVVAEWCNICNKQESDYNEDLIYILDSNTIFIQYFLEGNTEEIKAFYEKANKVVNDNRIILQENEEFNKYLKDELFIDSLPCFIFLKNNQITWLHVGYTNIEYIYYSYNYAFKGYLTKEQLIDSNNESIFKDYRTYLDVKEDLSEESLNRLTALDNDGKTVKLTCKNMGKVVDYTDLYSSPQENKNIDFKTYDNQDLILFYIHLDNSENDIEKINKINELANNCSYKCLAIVDPDLSSSSSFIYNYADDLKIDYVFYESAIPNTFRKITAKDYVNCMFIKKGTIAGAYSNVIDVASFNEAIDVFLTNSIALVDSKNK